MKELLNNERPREKLIKYGVSSLTDVELLAILLRTGSKKKSVMELAREILKDFDIDIISQKKYEDLIKYEGISTAKACQILACFELARRLGKSKNNIKISNSKDFFNYVKNDFIGRDKETVIAVLLNNANLVIKKKILGEGSIDFSFIDIRSTVKLCLDYNATGLLIAHNHFGTINPSRDDIEVTIKLKRILEGIRVRLLDHIIVHGNKYKSIKIE